MEDNHLIKLYNNTIRIEDYINTLSDEEASSQEWMIIINLIQETRASAKQILLLGQQNGRNDVAVGGIMVLERLINTLVRQLGVKNKVPSTYYTTADELAEAML